MKKMLIFLSVAFASMQSSAFELSEFTVYGCQNWQQHVSIDLEKRVIKWGFTPSNMCVGKIQDVRVDNQNSQIQFVEISKCGQASTYTLANIREGHQLGVIYADLMENGKKVIGCAGYLR